MKFRIFAMTIASASLLLFAACENELEKPVDFGVSVVPADGITFGDTIVSAPAGTSITFKFDGEPDFISFQYIRYSPTISTLSFTSKPSWGTHIENTLKVFLSDSFSGLSLNNFKQDSTNIAMHIWKDITAQCSLPIVANESKKSILSLKEYSGKNVTLAFLYQTTYAADWQPTWLLSDIQINDTVVGSTENTLTTLAATMGLSPFDMKNSTNPYLSESSAGVWNITAPAAIEMKRTAANNPLNYDWLITKPINIATGVSDTSAVTPVKNISSKVGEYSYVFIKKGTYKVKFLASKWNYQYKESMERELNVVIE